MSHLTHPIKADRVARLNYWDCRQTEIHKLGCAHATKVNLIKTADEIPQGEEPREDDGYADDWYKVAPCAR